MLRASVPLSTKILLIEEVIMKRSISFILAILCVFSLTACSSDPLHNVTDEVTESGKISDTENVTDEVADSSKTEINISVKSSAASNDVAALMEKMSSFYLKEATSDRNDYPDYNEWKSATFQLGMLEAFKATGNIDFYSFTLEIAESYGYLVNYGIGTTLLDNAAEMLVYTELDSITNDSRKLEDSIRNADYTLTKGSLNYSWVDEIYMVSSAYQYLAKSTGNAKYADIDYSSYMKWREKLFDETEGLWFRDSDYIYNPNTKYVSDSATPNVSPNGKKVFWSRGNAWVYVSLARNLRIMEPEGKIYEQYLSDFKSMTEALVKCVDEGGFWHANLADPDHINGIEMTGTGGFWFGICTGIELGILDAGKYIPIADSIYKCVSEKAVNAYGRLGYCQPIGEAPVAAKASDTNMFGVGLALMGAASYMRLCGDYIVPSLDTAEVLQLEKDLAESDERPYYLEPGFLKSSAVAKATSAAKKDHAENTTAKLFDGTYVYKAKGTSWVGGGLKTSNVVLDITMREPIKFSHFAMITRSCRAYKFRVEVSADGTDYSTVLDTTNVRYSGGRLYKWSFDAVEDVKYIRFVFTGIWGNAVDWVTINELFLYDDN